MERQKAGRFATKEYEFKVNSLGHSDTVPAEAAGAEGNCRHMDQGNHADQSQYEQKCRI